MNSSIIVNVGLIGMIIGLIAFLIGVSLFFYGVCGKLFHDMDEARVKRYIKFGLLSFVIGISTYGLILISILFYLFTSVVTPECLSHI